MEMKNLCGKLPVGLHLKVRAEIEQREIRNMVLKLNKEWHSVYHKEKYVFTSCHYRGIIISKN